jgi:hypothetical protein
MKRKRLSTKQGYWGAKKTKRASTPYGRPYWKNNSYNLYKSPRLIMPQEYVTTLRTNVLSTLNNAASTAASFQLRSDPFDIEPLLGGPSMTGLTELAAFYFRVRPLHVYYDIDIVNREAFALTVTTGFSLNSALVWSDPNIIGNPHTKTITVAGKGGMDRTKLKGSVSTVALFGTKQPLTDDLYDGSTTAAGGSGQRFPYFYCGIVSPSGTILTASGGVDYTLTFSIKCQFHQPSTLI